MTKTEAFLFFAALQRLMKRFDIDSIETQGDRVVFFGTDGKSRCSFERLDYASESLSDCVHKPGYKNL